MNEVLYSAEYLLRNLTKKDAAVFGIAIVGVFVVCRLLKAKKDKIKEKLDKRKK
ncbi:MAG: hypothetical protein IKW30_12050 [Lachnospiraceae bacterium]|nr:hypothetical protein [Lachnospiraceae bacterium]